MQQKAAIGGSRASNSGQAKPKKRATKGKK